jgi:hypothetical protein
MLLLEALPLREERKRPAFLGELSPRSLCLAHVSFPSSLKRRPKQRCNPQRIKLLHHDQVKVMIDFHLSLFLSLPTRATNRFHENGEYVVVNPVTERSAQLSFSR